MKKISFAKRNQYNIMRLAVFVFLLSAAANTVAFPEIGYAQKALERPISFQTRQTDLIAVLERLAAQENIKFIYNSELLRDVQVVGYQTRSKQLKSILTDLLDPHNLTYDTEGDYVLIKKKARNAGDGLQTIQEQILTGRVTDEQGKPLVGVNVRIRGQSVTTSTNNQGTFSLRINDEADVLIFSLVGYQEKEISIPQSGAVDIVLLPKVSDLEEVVIIGYGAVEKRDLTGAVSSIKSGKLLDRPVVNVGQALTSKIAGVDVYNNSGRPDGKINIRIRGSNSITASNEPLYVIDGVIGISDINLWNPNNIESIEVLKDASATAIYGARGANGVILITTKKGSPYDEGTLTYDGYVSLGVLGRKQNIEFLNADEWWHVYNIGFDNIEKYDPIGYTQGKFQKALPESLPKLFGSDGKPLYNTNWEREVYKPAFSQNHQISFSNANEKTSHRLYLGYLKHDALMHNNYLDRYNGQLNIDNKLKSWVTTGANLSFSYNAGNDLYSQVSRLIQEALPIIPVKYPDGSYGSNRDFPGAVQDTPLRYLEEMTNETTTSQFISNVYLDFKITADLNVKSTFAVDNRNRKNNYYVGKNLIMFNGKSNGGIASILTDRQLYWQNENYLNWNKQLNAENKFNFMLGLSWQQRSSELLEAEHRNFIDDFYQWHNLGSGTVNQPSSSADWKWSLNSYFARLNYSLNNKYLLTATARYDGSSKFGKNNQYAFFPSLAVAWQVSRENFLKDVSAIDDLKLRLSVGKTGNQEIANYAYSQDLGSGNIILGNQYYSALYASTFGNSDLKWETTTQFDAGIDANLLNNRIGVTFDVYRKITTDLLLNAPIPYTSGLSSVMQNIGSVRNHGVEIALNTLNITNPSFNWSSTLSFSANRNKILKLGTNNEDLFPTKHAQGDMQILRVGKPVEAYWGLTRLGTWGSDEEEEAAAYNRLPGDLKYADLNSDGKIDQNDNSIIGRGTPDWTLGLNNTLTYKNLDLSIDVRAVYGIDVMNAGTHNREDRSGVANGSKTILNAWTPTNQQTMVAELRYMKTYYDSYPDSHWLQDGSFVRVQNILLGYTFDSHLFNRVGFKRSRLYVSGQNLFLITNYKGYDPEVRTEDGAFGQGVDGFGEPRAKTYTLGVSLSF